MAGRRYLFPRQVHMQQPDSIISYMKTNSYKFCHGKQLHREHNTPSYLHHSQTLLILKATHAWGGGTHSLWKP